MAILDSFPALATFGSALLLIAIGVLRKEIFIGVRKLQLCFEYMADAIS